MTGVIAIGLLPLTVAATLNVVGLIAGSPLSESLTSWANGLGLLGWGIYIGGWIRGWER